ncbi:hypothetical protein BG011_007681 [Mortierella polycephala]|uniref:Uncharacterized protein n=1 Tax=Mortierella polycephala TaxID=41804 RepID=A0A9P6UB35_9FUNG|nr:hypothetical protein BG011_007681 [Mortierella polycephala]
MDLNWCPVCEQHIPLAWESSLYCSERCKQADEHASSPALGYSYPAEMQSFPRNNNRRNSPIMSLSSPMSSPTLTAVSPNSNNNNNNAAYPSPPTSPMSNYLYNKTSSSGRVSPPAFSLGHPAYDLELRRKSTTTIAAPQYMMPSTTSSSAKKGLFW